jgi:hypothetical protein
LVDAEIVSLRVAFHLLAALRAVLPVSWPLLHGIGLPLQRLVQHLLRKDLTNRLDGVFDGGKFGAPRGTLVTVEPIDQILGHAFEVGSNRIGGGGGNLVASHPWLLSKMRGVGNLEC